MKLGNVSVGPTKLAAGVIAVGVAAAVWPLASWLGPAPVLALVALLAMVGILAAGLAWRAAARRATVLTNRMDAVDGRLAAERQERERLPPRLDRLAEQLEQLEQRAQQQRQEHQARFGRLEQALRDQEYRSGQRITAAVTRSSDEVRAELRADLRDRTDDLRDRLTRLGRRDGQLDDLQAAVAADLDDLRRAAAVLAAPPTAPSVQLGAALHPDPADRIRRSGLFDEAWYRERHHDELAGADPVEHYLQVGWRRGEDPSPLVDLGDLRRRLLAGDREPLALFLDRERDGSLPDPGDPPVPLHADDPVSDLELRWRYLLQGGHRHDHTFALTRIVGNDLPPRHRAGQSLENLRFVLEHEPELPGCDRHWILNRIVDPDVEADLVRCLEDHGASYTRIPFVWDDYRRVGWRFEDFPEPGFVYGPQARTRTERRQSWILDHVYHDKNRYVMHNNGARNLALEQGRARARWVLPWDGNGFLTSAAWEQLVARIRTRPHVPYVLVPMARVLDNDEVLDPDFAPDAPEEPQIVFRSDAREAFDPDRRYGRRPKVELFQRLGVPGAWDGWLIDPWEPPIVRCADEGRYHRASYVVRLSSGQPDLELDITERGWRRTLAIQQRIDELDRRVVVERFSPDTPLVPALDGADRRTPLAADDPAAVLERDASGLADRPVDDDPAPRALADELLVLAAGLGAGGEPRYLDAMTDRLRALPAVLDRLLPDGDDTSSVDGPLAATPGWAAIVLDAGRLVRAAGRLDEVAGDALRRVADHARSSAGARGTSGVVGFDDDPSTVWHLLDALAGHAYAGDLDGVLEGARRSDELRGLRATTLGAAGGSATGGDPDDAADDVADDGGLRMEAAGWELLDAAVRRLGRPAEDPGWRKAAGVTDATSDRLTAAAPEDAWTTVAVLRERLQDGEVA